MVVFSAGSASFSIRWTQLFLLCVPLSTVAAVDLLRLAASCLWLAASHIPFPCRNSVRCLCWRGLLIRNDLQLSCHPLRSMAQVICLLQRQVRFTEQSFPDLVVGDPEQQPISQNLVRCDFGEVTPLGKLLQSRFVLIVRFSGLLLPLIETLLLERYVLLRFAVRFELVQYQLDLLLVSFVLPLERGVYLLGLWSNDRQ